MVGVDDDDDDYNNSDDDGYIVDSTSINEQHQYDSERLVEDDDVSMANSSNSQYPSDEDRTYQNIFEEENESMNEFPEEVSEETNRQSINVPREDPEEGEVFDDDDDEGVACREEEEVIDVKDSNSDKSSVNDDVKIIENVDSEGGVGLENVDNEHAGKKPDLKGDVNNDTNESVEESVDVKKISDVEMVVEDKAKETLSENKDENINSGVVEITVEDDDQQFADEVNVPSEKDNSVDDENVPSGKEQSEGEENEIKPLVEDVVEIGEAEASESVPSDTTRIVQPPRRIVRPPSAEIAPALTRNQMELLELEMRARAIKAMLKTAR